MKEEYHKKWNTVFSADEYAYGEGPNEYLKEQLKNITPGKLLFAAEGEGRNAVYAATLGWNVSAFDISEQGKEKALKLAKANNVALDYSVGELPSLNYAKESFDAIALIYAHFLPELKAEYHKELCNLLKKGGLVILEAFSKNHLKYRAANPKVGGPQNIDFLFSIEEIKSDFMNFEIIELVEKEIALNEGLYHNGIGSVIRFVGRKK
ncbi:bifunctional 2-polyprenyl-6-hydroxyphenol methylase/3-demethylubiquinol 3-O-methyltransferase UbiG [Cellulophaga sp. L1A9]|uniref:class I SAM-dependent methyltransferase n=1 Tax=Cellulophaga sp. L1A9 TaxID=2686362 RepID=UPI00131D33DC|nr:class I SAM-dependent methyltransferase [Cellulophaga sp. L1A9]